MNFNFLCEIFAKKSRLLVKITRNCTEFSEKSVAFYKSVQNNIFVVKELLNYERFLTKKFVFLLKFNAFVQNN